MVYIVDDVSSISRFPTFLAIQDLGRFFARCNIPYPISPYKNVNRKPTDFAPSASALVQTYGNCRNEVYQIAKGSLARQLPSYGRLSWAAFSPSCQPHHHQVVGRERVNSGLKTLGATPCVFAGKVASAVAEVESLFPRLRASICKSSRQNVHGLHRTVARAPIALENVKKKLRVSEHFWKMRSAKCARYCRGSSVSHKNREKWGIWSSLWSNS